MIECIFCKIVNSEIKANIIYSDECVIVFDDLNSQAKVHKLIVPKRHIATFNDMDFNGCDAGLLGWMGSVAQKLAVELGIAEKGYRLVMNCNEYGGQTVFHLHMHLLGGRIFNWPPG